MKRAYMPSYAPFSKPKPPWNRSVYNPVWEAKLFMGGRGNMSNEKANKTIFSCGYGNRAPDEFVKLLKDAGVTIVLDIRREGSRSWNGKYNQGVNMEMLLALYEIGYTAESYLGNQCASLLEYSTWLEISPECVERLVSLFDIGGACLETFCILCAEERAYKYDAEKWKARGTVNCHRVYVAGALVRELGDGWEVVHL